MKFLSIFIFLTINFLGFSQEIQEQYQKAKINYKSPEELKNLINLGISIDHGINHKLHFIISDFSISEIAKIRTAGFNVKVLIEDSKAHYLQQNIDLTSSEKNPLCLIENDYQTPQNFVLGSMGGYFTYQEMLNELDKMKALFPDLITVKTNISTFLTEGEPDNTTTPPIGENGIKWVKISDQPNNSNEGEPQLLYTAVHHAREPTSLSQLLFFMWFLLENYETDIDVKNILDHTELYFVPVVNPDGYLYNEKTDPDGGGLWRKNRKNGNGVDNNRNYEYFINGDPANGIWGGTGSSNDPTSSIYAGTSPFSEVENQAIKWFVEQHEFIIGVNNHSFGDGLFFPYAYDSDAFTPDHNLYETFLEELVSKNDYIYQKSAGLSGLAMDFMYGTVGTHQKIISFTPEIGSSFWLPSNKIIPTCKEMMYVNLTTAKMAQNNLIIKDNSSLFVGNLTTVDFEFSALNIGLVGNSNYTLSINPISSNIIAAGTPVLIIGSEPFTESNQSIQYTLDTTIEGGDNIIFELIVNNGIYNSITLINKKFGALTTLIEDTGDNINEFINNEWGITNEAFVSPSNSITDSPNSNYENNTNKTIQYISNIDISNAFAANIQFYAKWNIQNNSDYTQFEVSTDNGITWVSQCGKFTNEGSSNGSQPEGEPVYDGTQNEWVLEKIDLSDYIGEIINIRFKFVSDGNGNLDGFYFDDLTLNVLGEAVLQINKFNTTQFKIFPNPVKNILTINTTASNYSVEIYNIQGQLISEIDTVSETQTIDYSDYSRGIYLMRITSENATKTFKIVKE